MLAVVILSALLPFVFPRFGLENPQLTASPTQAANPEKELELAEAAIEQFILRGKPVVRSITRTQKDRPGRPILIARETRGENYRLDGYWGRSPSLTVPCQFAPPLQGSLANYWNGIRNENPEATGILSFSRPGYSNDGQSAWIFLRIDTGSGTSPRMDFMLQFRRLHEHWSLATAQALD